MEKTRKKSFLYLFYYLLSVTCSCNFLSNPQVDLFQTIGDEVDWANAPKLTVKLNYPSAWGTSNPPQGVITPAMDIRKDFEFSVEFTPETGLTLASWRAYRTSELDGLGNWMDFLDRIEENNIQTLGSGEVTLPAPVASGGAFKIAIHTTDPVTIVPWCDTQPRITRTEPRPGGSYPRASDITLYFNCALNRDTVRFANSETDDGIWITATTGDENEPQNNNDENWFSEPEYAATGGFFTVTMYSSAALPPEKSLMTVTVKGVRNMQNETMDEDSFSWNTLQAAANVQLTYYDAKYNDDGSISVSWDATGADKIETFYKLNGGSKIPISNANNQIAIKDVKKLNDSGVRNGLGVSDIMEYAIFIELHADEIMQKRAYFKIWNYPGMNVSDTNPLVEIRTADELAAINTRTMEKNNLDKQYVLAKDITLSGEWTPIGSEGPNNPYGSPFIGKFYGNGHAITLNGGFGGGTYRGLFGYVQGLEEEEDGETKITNALIRDLTFEYNAPVINASFNYSDFYIGGVAGYLKNVTVRNVTTSGRSFDINATGGNGLVRLGGIAGRIEGAGKIENCRAALSTGYASSGHTGEVRIGAIAGETGAGDANNTIVTDIKTKINLGTVANPDWIGPDVILKGLIIDGVTVAANVSADKKLYAGPISIGGAVGQNGQGGYGRTTERNTIKDIKFTAGTVSFSGISSSDKYCGGIAGKLENANIVGGSFAGNIETITDTVVNGDIYSGGLAGYIHIDIYEYYFIHDCRVVRTNINLISDFKKTVGGVLGHIQAETVEYGEPIPNKRITITKCYFDDGNINVKNSGNTNVGGFLGISMYGGINIVNCGIHSGTIIAKTNTEFRVGGFIGEVSPYGPKRPSFFSNCFSKIDIATIGSCQHFVGGFVAQIQQGESINACYATGTVSATIDGASSAGSSIGGFVGYSLGTIENCYALGNVLIDNNADSSNMVEAGGLVGLFYMGSISNCFSAGQVSAQSKSSDVYSGGLVGLGYPGTSINNTAVLGVSVTARGNGTKYTGRISGRHDSTSDKNYALKTMIVEEGAYNSTILAPPSPFPVGPSTKNGADTPSSTFLSQAFWKTTLGLPPDLWDFSRVAKNGYPELKNAGGL